MEFGQTELFSVESTRTISIRAFAQEVGVTDGCIRNKYIATGKISEDAIVRDSNGKVKGLNYDIALAQWKEFHSDEATDAADEKGGAKSYTEIQAETLRGKQLDNEEKEIRNAILKGDYISKAEALDAWGNFIRTVYDRIRADANRRKAKLKDQDHEERRQIDAETNALLRMLADYDPIPARKTARRKKAFAAEE